MSADSLLESWKVLHAFDMGTKNKSLQESLSTTVNKFKVPQTQMKNVKKYVLNYTENNDSE